MEQKTWTDELTGCRCEERERGRGEGINLTLKNH